MNESQQQDQAKRLASVNVRITAARQMLGANLDTFQALNLVGNQYDAETARIAAHQHLDTLLDGFSELSLITRAGVGL